MMHTAVDATINLLDSGSEFSKQQSVAAVVQHAVPKVLIVDDDIQVVEETREFLTNSGYQCVEANNAHEALQMIRTDQDISIIITDLMMPKMSGLAMVRTLKEELANDRDIEVIVLTGHSGMENTIEALYLGVMDFLCKPVSPKKLLKAVRRGSKKLQIRYLQNQYHRGLEYMAKERTTEIQKFADEIVESHQERALANRAIADLHALISYELRAQLTTVIGFSELMARMSEKSEGINTIKYSNKILEAGHKILTIINTKLSIPAVYGDGGRTTRW